MAASIIMKSNYHGKQCWKEKAKKRTICDLETNFRDAADAQQSSSKNCYLRYHRTREDSVDGHLIDG